MGSKAIERTTQDWEPKEESKDWHHSEVVSFSAFSSHTLFYLHHPTLLPQFPLLESTVGAAGKGTWISKMSEGALIEKPFWEKVWKNPTLDEEKGNLNLWIWVCCRRLVGTPSLGNMGFVMRWRIVSVVKVWLWKILGCGLELVVFDPMLCLPLLD